MAAGKRQSTPASRSSQPKRARAAPAADPRLKLVTQAVQRMDSLPKDVRAMLKAIVPLSLTLAHAERETCQQQVVELIECVFAEAEARLVAHVKESEADVSKARGESATASAAKDEATAALQAKASVVTEKQQDLTEKSNAVARAEAAVMEAEAAQRSGDADLEAAAAQKERVGAVHRDVFTPIKQGSLDSSSGAEQVESLLSLGRDLGLDETLLASLASALRKGASERGSFDGMVLEQFESEIIGRGEALGAAIAEGEPAKAERVRAVEEAKASCLAASAACSASSEILNAAKAVEQECQAALAAAAEAATSQESALAVAEEVLGMEKAKLATFQESPLAAFRELEAPALQPAVGVEDTEAVAAPMESVAAADEAVPAAPAAEA